MADEHDAGIDKQKLLDEIVGTSGSFEAVAPVGPPPVAAAPPKPAPRADAPPVTLPLLKPAPPVPPPPVIVPKADVPSKPLPRILEFRNEAAAMMLGMCGVIWSAIGIATHAWLPGGVGIVLLALAIGVWALEVLRDE